MSRRRKNREQAPAAPVQPPAAAPAPTGATDELQVLRDRLAEVERLARPEDPSPVAARRREEERFRAMYFRADGDTPCPLCGQVGGPQRQFTGAMFIRTPAWVCTACSEAVAPGYGTNSTRTFTRAVTLDRLACLAAGMERPTRSFRALAQRYGLTFTLAMDAEGGDGSAWSHLGDLDRWAEVGAKALRRDAAGFGAFPAPTLEALHPEMVDGRVVDLTHPRGWRHALVPKPAEQPSEEQLAAQLAAEEEAIEAELAAQARREAERAEEAARKAERARIDREYLAARAAQEALFEQERRRLREDRARVLKSADVRADFNAIVSSL